MNNDADQDELVFRWTSKTLLIAVVVALVVGIFGGYVSRSIQNSIQKVQSASLSAGIVNQIAIEIEEYRKIHGSFPETLNELDLENINLFRNGKDITPKLFYRSSSDSYDLILGTPSIVWIDEERIVRFR